MVLSTSNLNKIKRLCAGNKVKTLFAFGSVVRKDFNPGSDVDLLVDIDENDPLKYAEIYFYLKAELQQILNREIDLLEQKAIKNKFLRMELDRTKVLVYGHAD